MSIRRSCWPQDSSYAMHELRRIGVLAVVIMATLIGLGIFMR